MDITEIRIKLMEDPNDRLQAFCSITFDGCFVIRDLKIIQGGKGSFVAMPSRKLTDRCPRCSSKNALRSRFCSDCGARLQEERASKADDGRAKLYADIAHPINSDCRDLIQRKVLEAYSIEIERSKLPGYVCTYDDYGEESFATLGEDHDDMIELRTIVAMSDGIRRDTGAPRATTYSNGFRANGTYAGNASHGNHGHVNAGHVNGSHVNGHYLPNGRAHGSTTSSTVVIREGNRVAVVQRREVSEENFGDGLM